MIKYPKVGDTFYWKTLDGELKESVCKHIKEQEGVETMFFTCWDRDGGLFVNESSILSPDSKEIKKLLEQKEKDAWREFWTEDRILDVSNFITVCMPLDNIYEYLKKYIDSKIQ